MTGRPGAAPEGGSGRVLLAATGYGAAMLATGALLVAGPVTRPADRAGSVQVVADAPVLAPLTVPSGAPSGTSSEISSGPQLPVAEATQGRDTAARDAFRPTILTLWGGQRAPVVPAGVRTDGSLVVPDDPAVVGWWTGGAQAGEAFGHVVVAGHIDSARLGLGVLAEAVRARKGQVVSLADGARVQRYRVVSTRRLKKADLAKDRTIFAQDAGHRLVLITCGGRFDPVTHRYEDNLLVEAVPI